jgi:hypothetical protein
MPTMQAPDQLSPEEALQVIAWAMDSAAERGDLELTSQALDWCDQIEPRLEAETHYVLLDYFRANGWANRMSARRGDTAAVWAWDQEELQQQVYLLRRAIARPAFSELDLVRKCQILTNLANQLDTAGRFVEARQLWTRSLSLLPVFWMARANRGRSFMHYADALYDPGHKAVFALAAHRDLTDAVNHTAEHPELGDARLQSVFASHAMAIERHLRSIDTRTKYRPEGHSLGRSKTEQAYRRWCLNLGLFLNPLNDIGPIPIAARDVLTLPDLVADIHDPPVLIGFFNQLKQEFVSARWLYYDGITANRVHASDRGVLLYNTLDYPALGFGVEQVKVSFRMCYSLLDKIAYFLNYYLKLGIPEKRISFRHIWREKEPGPVRPEFISSENWPLRGLYWLSKDLFEIDFKEVMEPEAYAFHDLRNHLEHKYVKVVLPVSGLSVKPPAGLFSDTLAHVVSLPDLEGKTLRLLQLVRSALLYLSLGIHREEARRRESAPPGGLVMPMPLDVWEDDWKRRW